MKYILTAAQHKASDTFTSETIGIPSLVLMERAAAAMLSAMIHMACDLRKVQVICGTGNNAGDGAVLARMLAEKGYSVKVFLAGSRERFSEQMKQQIRILESGYYPNIQMIDGYSERKLPDFSDTTLIVDAIFGIGLKRPVEGYLREVIRSVNQAAHCSVWACDMPSGIDTDTGAVLGTAVKADATVTFTAGKPGLYLYPGASYAGEVLVKQIGIPLTEDVKEQAEYRVLEESDLYTLPARAQEGNKGTFGKILVAAGSREIFGAAYLAAKAALRSGAGMVKVFTHEINRAPLAALFPEALLSLYTDLAGKGDRLQIEKKLAADISWADCILVGPGLGTSDESAYVLDTIVRLAEKAGKPLVLDADALNMLSLDPKGIRRFTVPTVFTPHVVEMARLTGKSVTELKADPGRAAAELAEQTGACIVLKDARTVIAEPNGKKWINVSGCSALATAGSGDVLAGITAACMCLYRETEIPPAVLACRVHGRAGEFAAEQRSEASVIAGDLLDQIKFFV
ncbi:MAG: NAD(P)H-hydrate dehydratase [Eubacteriales bacterium]|nr:NAD(P)H-hydrate dehydratase [Eubacteriales bacterium]